MDTLKPSTFELRTPNGYGRSRAIGTRIIRALAGTTAGLRQTRRGSFLVVVVGTLALMSVFAIVYIAIGRADVGQSTGLKRNVARDDVPNQLAKYLREIIADDAVATAPVGEDFDPDPQNFVANLLGRREAWDYPSTAWRAWNTDTGTGPLRDLKAIDFSPIGFGTDPWLASTVPTDAGLINPILPPQPYMRAVDWLHISNPAPDGRFVNLVNLRNDFDASPQKMRGDAGAGAQRLTFFDARGGTSAAPAFGTYGPDPVVAQSDSYQRYAFRPMKDPKHAPGELGYLLNQWADADGDGMADSRFFELIDARDPAKIKNLLDASDRYRYFFATRIIDLSGLVNFTTATDFTEAPNNDARAGLRPSEVGLDRILGLEGQYAQSNANANYQIGYHRLLQPNKVDDPSGNSPDNYTTYDLTGANNTPLDVGAWAYDAVHQAIISGSVPAQLASKNKGQPTFHFGNVAAEPGSKVEHRIAIYDDLTGAAGSLAFGPKYSGIDFTGKYTLNEVFGSSDFLDLFTYRASNNPDIVSNIETITGGRYWGDSTPNEKRFDPLRGNRPFDLELSDRDPKNTGFADQFAMIQFAADVRHLLTPYSGARPIRNGLLAYDPNLSAAQQFLSAGQLQNGEIKVSFAGSAAAAFRAYSDALIPDSAIPEAWPNAAGTGRFNRIRFQHYGYASPELGLRVSAHLAANLEGAMAGGGSNGPYTVILDEAVRDGATPIKGITPLNVDYANPLTRNGPKDMAARNNLWAWWADGKQLDLGDNAVKNPNRTKSRLADSAPAYGSEAPTAPALNVYGVVPEPVITAVACYNVYTDAPSTAGGDTAFDEGYLDPDPGECTLDGRAGRPDFLMQVLAFQLTNPFDVAIDLCPDIDPTNLVTQDRFEYYIEFNNHFFRLVDLGMSKPSGSGPLSPAVLEKGQTRVFFATSQSLDEILERWKKIPTKLRDGTDVPDNDYIVPVQQAGEPFPMHGVQRWLYEQFKSGSGGGLGEPVWIEEMTFLPGTTGVSGVGYTAQRVPYSDTITNFVSDNSPPLIAGRDSDRKSVRLWRALRTPRSSGTAGPDAAEDPKIVDPSNPPPLPPQYFENDQLVDRLRDPDLTDPTLASQLGNINAPIRNADAYQEDDYANPSNDNLGLTFVSYGVIQRRGTPGGPNVRAGVLPGFLLECRTGTLNMNIRTRSPQGLDINDYNSNSGSETFGAFVQNLVQVLDGSAGVEFGVDVLNSMTQVAAPGPNQSSKSFDELKVELAQGFKGQTLRLGDLLLPLAIGPEFVPADPAGTSVTKFDDQYLTVQEALALALDYDIPADPTEPYYLYNRIGRSDDPANPPKLDRAMLVLDDFAPFYDDPTNDGVFTIDSADRRRGLGIPLALNVLDTFRALPGKFGSLTRATTGLININTAPLAVLRTVPMLSPSTVVWWGTPVSSEFSHGVGSDIAATVIAYRDKIEVQFRPGSQTPDPSASFNNIPKTIKPSELEKLNGRDASTYVPGVREQPGFKSLGEIMLARQRTDYLDPNLPSLSQSNSPNNIDYLAFNANNDRLEGVNSVSTSGGTLNGIRDDYEEKLMVANGALNSLSVRSDVYAVWFVVHGYQKSDVQRADGQPLAATDPMVPSIQRRFLMVVDRSNVTAKGQQPRVILFKEVPL